MSHVSTGGTFARGRVLFVDDSAADEGTRIAGGHLASMLQRLPCKVHPVAPLNNQCMLSGAAPMRNVVVAPERTPPAVDLRAIAFAGFTPTRMAVAPGRIDFGRKGQQRLVASRGALAERGIGVELVGDGGDGAAPRRPTLRASHGGMPRNVLRRFLYKLFKTLVMFISARRLNTLARN